MTKIDHIIILTYPGHFFMTKLCLDSIKKHYPNTPISILVDDIETTHWPKYVSDCCDYYQQPVMLYSTLLSAYPGIRWGWWRQQLIKLCVDAYVKDETIFLVDGDVIFDSYVDPNQQPIQINQPNFPRDNIDQLCDNYVRHILKIEQGHLTVDDKFAPTSPTPWRLVTRTVLKSLRNYVYKQHNEEFIALHARLIDEQQIVGYDESTTKLSFSEWELIECYRTFILKDNLEPKASSAGQHTFDNTRVLPFRHSSLTDANVGRAWLEWSGLYIHDMFWEKSQKWINNRVW